MSWVHIPVGDNFLTHFSIRCLEPKINNPIGPNSVFQKITYKSGRYTYLLLTAWQTGAVYMYNKKGIKARSVLYTEPNTPTKMLTELIHFIFHYLKKKISWIMDITLEQR